MEKKFVVKAIIVLILSVFIANILLAFIILPALTSPPSFWEILLFSVTNPAVLTLAMGGGGLWLILSELGKRETAIPDRYRIYLTFILTVIALLSIQLLSMKVIETPLYPPYPTPPTQSQYPIWEYNSSIIPPL